MMHSSYYSFDECCDVNVASICTSTVNLAVYSATYFVEYIYKSCVCA